MGEAGRALTCKQPPTAGHRRRSPIVVHRSHRCGPFPLCAVRPGVKVLQLVRLRGRLLPRAEVRPHLPFWAF